MILADLIVLRETPQYRRWLENLPDKLARARISVRMRRVEEGLFGDVRSVGGGVSELRFDFGPGYRVYFGRRGSVLVLLLCGGDKSSQQRDIEAAQKLWERWKDSI